MLSFRNNVNVDAIVLIFLIAYLIGSLFDRTVLVTSHLSVYWRKGSQFYLAFPSFDVIVP